MVLIEDKGNQAGKHCVKHAYWESIGVPFERYPLPVGDYIIANDKVLDVIARKQRRGNDVKKMDFLGTYSVAVDTKRDMTEIVGNICGQQHARFRDECILAQNNGIKLYVLIENTDKIGSIEDVFRWQNPRMHRYNKIAFMHNIGKWLNVPLPKSKPTDGRTLAKAMLTMENRYDVVFKFCNPAEAGERILSLLNMGQE